MLCIDEDNFTLTKTMMSAYHSSDFALIMSFYIHVWFYAATMHHLCFYCLATVYRNTVNLTNGSLTVITERENYLSLCYLHMCTRDIAFCEDAKIIK